MPGNLSLIANIEYLKHKTISLIASASTSAELFAFCRMLYFVNLLYDNQVLTVWLIIIRSHASVN